MIRLSEIRASAMKSAKQVAIVIESSVTSIVTLAALSRWKSISVKVIDVSFRWRSLIVELLTPRPAADFVRDTEI